MIISIVALLALIILLKIFLERIYAQLRSEGIDNLGQVKRLYLEAGGSFSLIKEPEPQKGVSIIPDWDDQFYNT